MFKKEYYCLVAGLPDLFFNESRTGFDCTEFREELILQLSPADQQLVQLLFWPFDNENLLNLIFQQEKALQTLSNLTRTQLEKELEQPQRLPAYIIEFLIWNRNQPDRDYSIIKENKLHALYYKYALRCGNEFLTDWFTFEINLKNILTAINCSKFDYDTRLQLIETGDQNEVYELLASKRLKHELFEDQLPQAEKIFKIAQSEKSWLEKEKAVDLLKWEALDEATFFHYFTVEKILGYTLKLLMVERWMKLDRETGAKLMNDLINDLKNSYSFPAEFSVA